MAASGQSHKCRRISPCVRERMLLMLADRELEGSGMKSSNTSAD
jgi:hypothetical protein